MKLMMSEKGQRVQFSLHDGLPHGRGSLHQAETERNSLVESVLPSKNDTAFPVPQVPENCSYQPLLVSSGAATHFLSSRPAPPHSTLILQFAFSNSLDPDPRLDSHKMNTSFGLVVAALAFVSSVRGEECNPAVQGEAFKSLMGVMASTNLTLCSSKSGYSMMTATALATDKQTGEMCRVPECYALIAEVKATNPPDCLLTNPMSNLKMNIKVLANSFQESCNNMAISPDSPASSSTPMGPPASPVVTPVSPMTPPASPMTPGSSTSDTIETERMIVSPTTNVVPPEQLFVMPIPNTAC